METKTTLDNDTLDALQELIEINIDSAEGFRDAADRLEDAGIASLFARLAEDRVAQAKELQAYVRLNQEEPEDSGSVLGTVHRLWMDFRAAINGGDTKVILIEAEKGEDAIKGKYEKLIKATAGSAVNDVLLHQYAVVKVGHDRVRDLRDLHLKS